MPKLPVSDLGSLTISGSAEQLSFFLSPIDSEGMRARIGREKMKKVEGPLEVAEGQVFKTRTERLVGMRYLYRDEQGDLVGVAHLTRIGRRTVLSNIYVRPDKRERGIASFLLGAAKSDFPRLQVDTSMTEMGAKFFGYTREMVEAHKVRESALEAVAGAGAAAKIAP